jgi:asparagine synthase (glutamine-hydrolysing)
MQVRPSKHVVCQAGYGWETRQAGNWTLHWVENIRANPEILAGLLDDGAVAPDQLADSLLARRGFYAFIAESPSHLVAVVDRVRSHPVFYSGEEGHLTVSNSARALRDELGSVAYDPVAVTEFQLTCWASGRLTLVRDLFQLQAGEFLVFNKVSGQLTRRRYYLFYSDRENPATTDQLIGQLDAIHDKIFKGIIERADGRPIWIPLSGGWDSRLIASKLAQLGYDNIQTFSYGVRGNHETKLAKRVAEVLGLPWFEVPITGKSYSRYYWSDRRKAFFGYSDGLCSLPFMQDISVLEELLGGGRMPRDAILINGQSGDFITGGHIHADQVGDDLGIEGVINSLLDHHHVMWQNLRTPTNMAMMRAHLTAVLEELRHAAPAMPTNSRMTECWEWQERQCKYVVNGQRAYDLHGLDWELPLWENDYLEFWPEVPQGQKLKQALYKECLRRTGYRDVFNVVPTQVWRWPGVTMAIIPVARAVGLLFGNPAKDALYRRLKWLGHYRYCYSAFGYLKVMRFAMITRDPDSFNIETWGRENGLFEITSERSFN